MTFNSSGQYFDPPLSTWAPQTLAQPDFGDPIFGQGIQTLTGLGVHPDVAHGAINYMYRNESKLDPTIVNPTSGAFGIGQWLGPRLQALKSKYGDSPTADQQFQHMTDELQGPEKSTLSRLLQAKSAKEGYDIWGSSYERPGAAALAKAGVGNNNMLPAFGNTRALAQLTPSVEQTGGVAMDDPSAAATPGGPQLGLAGFGPGGITSPAASSGTDITAMLPQLMAKARALGLVNNPSQTLANMSAGFFGGRGPAQSLAGGFAGLAKSQGQDQTEGMGLLKMAMMYGPLMQQQLREKNMTALAAATRQGQIPASMAAKGLGMTPQDLGATSWDDIDNAYRAGMPLPATAQKSIQDATGGIASQRNNQIQLKTIRDQIANGDFELDAAHRAYYHVLNTIGIPTEASSKFQAMQQTLGNMQADLMNSQKGAASDKRAELALSQLTGGGGLTSNAQAINHFDYLGNHAALAEKNLRQKLEQSYTLSKQKMPADFMPKLDATLPASPYGGVDPNIIGRQLYGDNTTNPNASAAPGQPLAGNTPVAAPVGNTSGALPPGAIRLPDGRIAIPKNP